MWRDSSGRRLEDYRQPSVAVDTAVLTVDPDGALDVLLVRGPSDDPAAEWSLPGTFLHEGERLEDAVLRSLASKAGLEGKAPRQLHVFDDPGRDWRGWVLSVAHVVVLPWAAVQPLLGQEGVAVRRVDEAVGLPYDHDKIVARAVGEVRRRYRERPDPEHLLEEPFTLRQLRQVHEAVLGKHLVPDTFRRRVLDRLRDTGQTTGGRGEVGRPAALFRRLDEDPEELDTSG